VAEYVVPLDVMVRWDAIAPAAEIAGPVDGVAAVALAPHPDDADQRTVILRWTGARSVTISDPHAPLSRHRLYEHGLRDIAWMGVVRNTGVDPEGLVQHLVLLDDRTVEVVAELLTVQRSKGSTADVAQAAVRS
jgi:acetyl-CoA acetyltransferase